SVVFASGHCGGKRWKTKGPPLPDSQHAADGWCVSATHPWPRRTTGRPWLDVRHRISRPHVGTRERRDPTSVWAGVSLDGRIAQTPRQQLAELPLDVDADRAKTVLAGEDEARA